MADSTPRAPRGLGARGKRLWAAMVAHCEFSPAEVVLLEEACRVADRLEKLDGLIRGEVDSWARLEPDLRRPPRVVEDADGEITRERTVVLVFEGALSEARQQENILKQLVASLRIPDDATGKKPQQRGGGRGAYTPGGKTGASKAGGKVSSIERARQAAAARGA